MLLVTLNAKTGEYGLIEAQEVSKRKDEILLTLRNGELYSIDLKNKHRAAYLVSDVAAASMLIEQFEESPETVVMVGLSQTWMDSAGIHRLGI